MNDLLVKQACDIVRKHVPQGYDIFLFGSRTGDVHHKYSDIDIGIEGPSPLSMSTISKVTEALEESDLPVQVDIVDFKSVSPDFTRIANKTRMPV